MITEPILSEADLPVADYLTLWGCDPSFDLPPRIPGDGDIFYRFDPQDIDYLRENLLPALGRQLQDDMLSDIERADLEAVRDYVKALIEQLAVAEEAHPIIRGMARALFACAWADSEEEQGRSYGGCDILDVAPPTPRSAFDTAHNLCGRIEQANGTNIHALLWRAAVADGLPHDDPGEEYADEFGHYLAMQALGHGVSWFDNHAKFPLKIPHIEYYLECESC